MTYRPNIFALGAVAALAALASSCVQPDTVEVRNGCGQTLDLAHFEPDSWVPEVHDQMLAELEWVRIEPGSTANVEMDFRDPMITITIVAEGAEQLWDPISAPIEWGDSDGVVILSGDVCAPLA
jgi:hypothetical protein